MTRTDYRVPRLDETGIPLVDGTTPILVRYSPGRRLALCLFAVGLTASVLGCSSGPRAVLASVNVWEYWNARQAEDCRISTPVCDCRWEALQAWRKRLDEAGAAVKRGGKMPLQLAALKGAEAAHGACSK